MPCPTRFGSNGYGPSECCRIASGRYGWSLSQISTVGARLPGLSMHGLLRAPRTMIGESCGSLQYMPSGVSMVVVSAGLRHDDGGRKPTVQGSGSLIVIAKSPSAYPVGLRLGATAWIPATDGGNNTNSCSNA